MSSSLPRKSYARIPVNIKLPNLIEVQLDSFERLKREGLGDLFHEVSPIESYNKGMKLYDSIGETSWNRSPDRKSTRLNSSHANISYAVFCLETKSNRGSHRDCLLVA